MYLGKSSLKILLAIQTNNSLCHFFFPNEYEAFLNDTFVNIDSDVKSYDICDEIDELIDELDKGVAVGLPYHNLELIAFDVEYFLNGIIVIRWSCVCFISHSFDLLRIVLVASAALS